MMCYLYFHVHVHVLSNPSDGIKFHECNKKSGIPCPIKIGQDWSIISWYHNHLNCIEKTAFDATLSIHTELATGNGIPGC